MARVSRARHIKRARFARTSRSKRFRSFLAERATTLDSTATPQTFTAVATTDVCTKTSHGFKTGDGPFRVSNSGGALPGGMSSTAFYWVIAIDANTFKWSASRGGAIKGVALDLTSDGTGTNSYRRAINNAEASFWWLRGARKRPRTMMAADIDSV